MKGVEVEEEGLEYLGEHITISFSDMIFPMHWPIGGGGGGGGAGGAIEDADNEVVLLLGGGGGAFPRFVAGDCDDTWGEGGAGGCELGEWSDMAFLVGGGGGAFCLDSSNCLLASSMPPRFSTKS